MNLKLKHTGRYDIKVYVRTVSSLQKDLDIFIFLVIIYKKRQKDVMFSNDLERQLKGILCWQKFKWIYQLIIFQFSTTKLWSKQICFNFTDINGKVLKVETAIYLQFQIDKFRNAKKRREYGWSSSAWRPLQSKWIHQPLKKMGKKISYRSRKFSIAPQKSFVTSSGTRNSKTIWF